jgi:hypothetical protein
MALKLKKEGELAAVAAGVEIVAPWSFPKDAASASQRMTVPLENPERSEQTRIILLSEF